MVRLTGPSLAAQASGSFANTLTFSKSKGRSYVKFKASPKQPNTPPQKALKAYWAGISNSWKQLPALYRATWEPLAAQDNILTNAAFIKWNMQQFRLGQPPSYRYPPWDIAASATWPIPTATKRWNSIRLDWNISALASLWFIQITKTWPAGLAYLWSETTALVEQKNPGTGRWIDTAPDTGTNSYLFWLISRWAKYAPLEYKVNVIWP